MILVADEIEVMSGAAQITAAADQLKAAETPYTAVLEAETRRDGHKERGVRDTWGDKMTPPARPLDVRCVPDGCNTLFSLHL